jgi:hypothetical protein
MDFSAYQAATGQDAHSQYVDPNLLNLVTPDLEVGSQSPALRNGFYLGELIEGDTDFAGKMRIAGTTIDIGAYQAR